jgi:hypothetical protein
MKIRSKIILGALTVGVGLASISAFAGGPSSLNYNGTSKGSELNDPSLGGMQTNTLFRPPRTGATPLFDYYAPPQPGVREYQYAPLQPQLQHQNKKHKAHN